MATAKTTPQTPREKSRLAVLASIRDLQTRLSDLEAHTFEASPENHGVRYPTERNYAEAAETLGRSALAVAMNAAQFTHFLATKPCGMCGGGATDRPCQRCGGSGVE